MLHFSEYFSKSYISKASKGACVVKGLVDAWTMWELWLQLFQPTQSIYDSSYRNIYHTTTLIVNGTME